MPDALLEVEGLVKHFPVQGANKVVHACGDVTFSVERGETFGVIGESGSGKTTLGRCILHLARPTSGSVRLDGVDLTALGAKELRAARRKMHIVFQEPGLSMNPQLSVGFQIAEPLRIHTALSKSERAARVAELLALVNLPVAFAGTLPSNLSGGELQRCSIARALAAGPDLIVLDEPTSALPPATQADIVDLLKRLQREIGLTYIFISHDLSLAGSFCDRIAVMYLGQIVELGRTEEVFAAPRHPYTRALIASMLEPDPDQRDDPARRAARLEGEIPSPIDLPPGCFLASRCHHALDRCQVESQQLATVAEGHLTRCWRMAEGDLPAAAAPGEA